MNVLARTAAGFNPVLATLEPEWCVALLTAWSTSDTPQLGHRASSVWLDASKGETSDSDEMRVLADSLADLKGECPVQHACIHAAFRPWVKYLLPAEMKGTPTRAQDLQDAVKRLADMIDERMDC